MEDPRYCRRCKTVKPLSEFEHRSKLPDPQNRWCKDCFRENQRGRDRRHND